MKNQLLKISRLKIAIIARLWPVAMTVGSLQRDFFLQKGGLMPERTERLLKLALEAWEVMTDSQKDKFIDFLDRLVVKGEKFTDKQIIQIASEGVQS